MARPLNWFTAMCLIRRSLGENRCWVKNAKWLKRGPKSNRAVICAA